MAKLPLYLPEHICLKIVEGEIPLCDATKAFLEVVPDGDYLEFACPGCEILFQSPSESQLAEYEMHLMSFFTAMLDGFTEPDRSYDPPMIYPIPRSAPDSK